MYTSGMGLALGRVHAEHCGGWRRVHVRYGPGSWACTRRSSEATATAGGVYTSSVGLGLGRVLSRRSSEDIAVGGGVYTSSADLGVVRVHTMYHCVHAASHRTALPCLRNVLGTKMESTLTKSYEVVTSVLGVYTCTRRTCTPIIECESYR